MKKLILLAAFAVASTGLFAVEHPINCRKNSDQPASFYNPSKDRSGTTCVKNEAGKYVFRIDAKNGQKKLISGRRIAIAEKDTITFRYTINARAKSVIGAGAYIYCEVNKVSKHITAAYDPTIQVVPGRKVYEVTRVIQPNAKAKSGFERPSIALMFFDFRKGSDLDVEKIEYIIKKAPAAKAPVVPDF